MKTETLVSRSQVNPAHTWDLTPLFTADTQWDSLYAEIERDADGYAQFEGRLGESAALFLKAIEFDLAISRRCERLFTYAHLRNDEDKTDSIHQSRYDRAISLHTTVAEKSSYIVPEIQSLDDATVQAYLCDPALAAYRFFLEKIIRYKPHTRSKEVEHLLAQAGEIHGTASEIFSQLDDADLTFGTITAKGETIQLTHGNFGSLLQNPDRGTRKAVFDQYYGVYDAHRYTLAASLGASIKKDRFYTKVRSYPSCIEGSLFSDNVSLSVYDSLINSVRSQMAPLVKYLEHRKRILGIDELHMYDTYVPLVSDIPFSMSYEEAVAACCDALAPLGSDYVETMRKGLLEGWVDRYENKGKRSGAYSSGCYDSPPYILMNYRDDNINSVYTLIHEAGHSMHSHYSHTTQPYHESGYTIFVAEVASTFNETLLSHHLLKRYENDKAMRSYILNREIDNIRATLYRQTMFAEFEKITHAMAEHNEPLTLDAFRSVYRSLLETYFGGALTIDNTLELECLRIPHFYNAFYVYKYATGISAAIALAEKVLHEGEPARGAYRKFLTLGGSLFPIDELKVAGVDMSKPETVNLALAHFSKLVDEFTR
jgi:oligoendopeptidase F